MVQFQIYTKWVDMNWIYILTKLLLLSKIVYLSNIKVRKYYILRQLLPMLGHQI